jgi:hypothetical protein
MPNPPRASAQDRRAPVDGLAEGGVHGVRVNNARGRRFGAQVCDAGAYACEAGERGEAGVVAAREGGENGDDWGWGGERGGGVVDSHGVG